MKSQEVRKINQQFVVVVLRDMLQYNNAVLSCFVFLILTYFFLFRLSSFYQNTTHATTTATAKKEVRSAVVVQSE